MTTRRTRLRAIALAATGTALALALVGCGGSIVDPRTAAEAQNGTDGISDSRAAGAQNVQTSDVGADVSDVAAPGDAPGGAGPVATTADPGGSASGGGGGTSGGGGGGGKPAAVAGASCAGFRNGPGMTDSVVRIGNASDLSGPVPGLFKQAQNATRAFVEYFNSTGARICGRKLELDLYDSRTDAGADQAAYVQGCDKDFAMVGSMSAFDSGGARTAQACGIPDVRAIATTSERTACRTCFAAQPAGPNAFQNAVPDFLLRRTSGQKAGMLYLNAGAAATNGKSQVRHSTKRGMKYVVEKPIDVADFSYQPYVQALKDAGAESVQFIGAEPQFVRLAKAMQEGGYVPKVFLLDPTAYSQQYTGPAGAAAKGTFVFLNFTPFEEARNNPELALYLRYLQKVSPGAKPTFFGLFAWSASRLFAQEATKLGGKLTRASLLAAMAKIDNWTGNGIHSVQHVGSKKIGDCWRFVQWTGSAWVPVDGTAYRCSGLTSD